MKPNRGIIRDGVISIYKDLIFFITKEKHLKKSKISILVTFHTASVHREALNNFNLSLKFKNNCI